MKGMLSIFIIISVCFYACAASESIQYIATGRVCRPKNNDGYSRVSAVDTPQSCQQKCNDDSARCGAWEFEDHDMDNKECELHERDVISYQDTKDMGECQVPDDGIGGDYRCCWIAKDIVDLQSTSISNNIDSISNESATFTTIEEEESKVNVSLGEIESHIETADNTSKTSEASIRHITLVGCMCLSIIFI